MEDSRIMVTTSKEATFEEQTLETLISEMNVEKARKAFASIPLDDGLPLGRELI